MANVFSGSEIVAFGIQIESNGRDFYNILAAKASNPAAKEIFEFLADEETEHILIFQKILESIRRYEPSETYPGEYFAYMSMLAGEYVFTRSGKGKEIAKSVKNDKGAIDVGIKFEEESIIFYDRMKKTIPEDQLGVIDKLIEQENGHLFKLLKLRGVV